MTVITNPNDVYTLAQWLAGDHSNWEQAIDNPPFFAHIRVGIRALPNPITDDGVWLFLEQAYDYELNHPYRTAVLHLIFQNDRIEMINYRLKNAETFFGASRDRVIVSKKDDIAYGDAIRTAVPNVEFYSLGSFGLKVMEVVQGRASAYIYLNRRVKLWDTVGPLAIAKAAGLVCCDLTGREIGFGFDDIDPEKLTHNQVVVIGWSEFIDGYLEAIAQELSNFEI